MKQVAAGLLVLLLAGCDQPLTRKEYIAAAKECTDAGFKFRVIRSGWDFLIIDVECTTPTNSDASKVEE